MWKLLLYCKIYSCLLKKDIGETSFQSTSKKTVSFLVFDVLSVRAFSLAGRVRNSDKDVIENLVTSTIWTARISSGVEKILWGVSLCRGSDMRWNKMFHPSMTWGDLPFQSRGNGLTLIEVVVTRSHPAMFTRRLIISKGWSSTGPSVWRYMSGSIWQYTFAVFTQIVNIVGLVARVGDACFCERRPLSYIQTSTYSTLACVSSMKKISLNVNEVSEIRDQLF